MKKHLLSLILLAMGITSYAQREEILINNNWKFCYGHSLSMEKNFYIGTKYFNYLTKTGYADGPAAKDYDDRPWRQVNLPHDYALEQGFAQDASHSHGYKTIGWKYPENSLGWYRKTIQIPQNDYGKKISVHFEGIFRDSEVWFNGFYLGREQSGYTDFEYDVTDYVEYGGDNVITVKSDALLEEGWFYEGAGIYRNVYLKKTNPLFIEKDGIYTTSKLSGNNAELKIRTNISNKDRNNNDKFSIRYTIFDNKHQKVKQASQDNLTQDYFTSKTYYQTISLENITRWDVENPYLYTLEIEILKNGKVIDNKNTRIGFRDFKFTADKGFFLNGKHLKLIGSNVHQDFAGVGCAVEDELQYSRIKILKGMGTNCVRTSHNPVNVAFLDACDSLGLIVLEETRLEGINDYHYHVLENMIKRDRNHPSIVAFSVGNEEWQIESNIYGNRITSTIQDFAKTLDSSRVYTVAVSGGCGYGSSEPIEIMGFNYLAQCDIDQYHQKFPNQPSWGTEETSGCGTRGTYFTNKDLRHMTQYDREGGTSIERGFKFYMEREFLSGLFYWTGFDYRGEPTPFDYPAVLSQFGLTDLCGFYKEQAWYIKINTSKEPLAYIFPHWNLKGHEGEEIELWTYANTEEIEVIANKKSLGKQKVEKYGHNVFKTTYQPGSLKVIGYNNGKIAYQNTIQTTSEPVSLKITADKQETFKDKDDIVLFTISSLDKKGLEVPTANNKINFTLEGDGEILGVGNGDPSSLAVEKFFDKYSTTGINIQKELTLKNLDNWKEEFEKAKESDFIAPFPFKKDEDWTLYYDSLKLEQGEFVLEKIEGVEFKLYPQNILYNEDIYINGVLVAKNHANTPNDGYPIDSSILKKGKNQIIFVGKRLRRINQWDEPNTYPGLIGMVEKQDQCYRELFNGKALVVVKTFGKNPVTLKAESQNLKEASLTVK